MKTTLHHMQDKARPKAPGRLDKDQGLPEKGFGQGQAKGAFASRHRFLLLPVLALGLLLAPVEYGHALDSTFKPTSGIVTPQSGSSIPVGTVVAWPVTTNPSDWDNWLECNGGSISASSYPKLVEILTGSSSAATATLPDYRGLFLRGYGYVAHQQTNGSVNGTTMTLHVSAGLGVVQGDAIRDIYGTLPVGDAWGSSSNNTIGGVFGWATPEIYPGFAQTDSSNVLSYFQASRVVPTASEIRPVNKAVRYLIRAR